MAEMIKTVSEKDILTRGPDCLTAGVISDTHGMLVPEVLQSLMGVDLIIHAGDIDTPFVLDELNRIAPTVAVRGNMDRGRWAAHLPETKTIELGNNLLYILHDIYRLDIDPSAAGICMVIHGHTHQPSDEFKQGARFLNPGSASSPRGNAPLSILKLNITEEMIQPVFVPIK